MKPVIIEDLYEFDFIGDMISSEDGKRISLLVNKASLEDNNYKSEVYIFEHGKEVETLLKYPRFENLGAKLKPLYISNEGVLFILGSIEDGEEKENVIIKYDISNNTTETIFTFEKKPEKVIYTRSGNIFWTVRNSISEFEENDDFMVFDELPFWENAKGIVDKTRVQLFCKLTGQDVKMISKPIEEVTSIAISSDEGYFAYTSKVIDSMDDMKNSVNLLNIKENSTITVHDEKKLLIHDNLCFIDNDKLFFSGFDEEFPGKNHLPFIYDISKDKVKEIPYPDTAFGGAQVTDVAYGKAPRLIGRDGRLYFTRSVWGQTYLYNMDGNGNLEQMTPDNLSIMDFAFTEGGFYTVSLMDGLLHRVCLHTELKDGGEFKYRELGFPFNKEYCETHLINKSERFVFKNRDGVDMEVYVLIPKTKENSKVPVILQIHGGPKAVYGHAFNHEFQILASAGYASVFLNPRGSDGRGSEFANITGELGYMDYDDLMEGFEEALKRYPELDSERAGVSGGSYGGLMVNWIIGHTSRFKAACSQRSISSYTIKPFTTDIGYYHNLKQLKATPWEDFERVQLHSPLAYSKMAKTPTLFIHSDEDYRCWQVEGISMYNALKMNGTPAKFVLFYGESHGLSRTGKPHNRVKRLKEILNWFELML